MTGIRLQNISKTFDKKIVAVDNFSLEIGDNEIMVIVGPSGCGKTTTLRIIAGLERPDRGNIYIGGRLVNKIPPKDRDVAMVFQSFALYPHMSVFENVAFPLKMRKVPRPEIRQRVEKTAGLLGIENLLSRRPHTLSGGQKQRVAIARAIVRNPKVFLYDEPLSNLDAQMRLAMRAELKALHNRLQTATVYVTHDQSEAVSVGDRICVMKEGRIHQVGTPQEIYERPADKFVASFFGTPPMNFFTGRLSVQDDLPFFDFGSVHLPLPSILNSASVDNLCGQLVLGVRPEHISFHPLIGQMGNCVDATIELIEPQGQRKSIYMVNDCAEKFVVSSDSGRKFQIADKVKVYIDTERVFLFESGPDGKRVNA